MHTLLANDGPKGNRMQVERGPRSIFLGTLAMKLLTARRKRRCTSPFVFQHPKSPSRSMNLPSAMIWRTLKEDAQLPGDTRLYDLPHNFASHSLIAGESLQITGSMSGQTRPSTTARYADLADDSSLTSAQAIGTTIAQMADITRNAKRLGSPGRSPQLWGI